jgi:hypothetical protein
MNLAPDNAQLDAMTDNELAARYNAAAASTVVGAGFYREEIARRQIAKESARMLALTRSMSRLTWAIFVLTVFNVVLAAVPLFR